MNPIPARKARPSHIRLMASPWYAAPLLAALVALGGASHAAGTLDELLGGSPRSPGSGAGASTPPPLFNSAAGQWRLVGGAGGNGLDCAVGFYGEKGFFGLVGPTSDAKGALLFMGPDIAPVPQQRQTEVILRTDKDPADHTARPLRAHRLAGTKGVIAVGTDMAATLRGIADVTRLTLEHEGRQVLELRLEGTFRARDALARCMGLPPIGGKR